MDKSSKSILSIVLIVFCTISFAFKGGSELNLYVSPGGNDANVGTAASPFRTIKKAQEFLRSSRKSNTFSKITVNLMAGNYAIAGPLTFGYEDGGTADCPVEYKAYDNGEVYISGGISLPKNWVKDPSADNIWKLKISSDYQAVNQLFANGKRLDRSRSPLFYTKGPINIVKEDVENLGLRGSTKFVLLEKLKANDLLPLSSFAYANADLDNLNDEDLANAEMSLYHSWQNTWHKIQKVNKVSGEVFLKTPSGYPVGFFSNRNRYFIENTRRYLKTAESWFYDKKSGQLFYKAKSGINPNTINFVIPSTGQLLNITGNQQQAVTNIKFSGIQFQYSEAPRGVNPEAKRINSWATKNTPWVDYKTGFSGGQGAIDAGQAVRLFHADSISFSKCKFTNIGSYAIRIDSYSNNNEISDCQFSNLGAGGVIIGFNDTDPVANHIPVESCPANNVIKNCVIHDIGTIYTSGLAIAVMNAVKSTVANNTIYNTPYSGISSGWKWGRGKSYTRDNIIEGNTIYNVMQQLADGGGIYTLGSQPGTIIRNNTVHDIGRNKDAVGSRNDGIMFDEGSAQIYVDGNKIYNIENEPVRYNEAEPSNIEWGTNEINGESYTNSDGVDMLQSNKYMMWLTDSRFKSLVTKTLEKNNWIYYTPLLLLPIGWLLYKKRKKRKKYSRR